MQHITEQQIISMAPNPAAAANAKKISQKGGFVRRERSEDDTFYLGECTGSGKSNYITTADFLDPQAPVLRCSCPSRQFPCKHGLALLMEIAAQKPFGTCEIPEDILKKRERKQARAKAGGGTDGAAGSAAGPENGEQGRPAEAGGAGTGKAKRGSSGASKAARTRKMKKQLEGLALTEKMVCDLMSHGLGTMGGSGLETYRELSRQLGDYYLPGPQRLLNRLILEIAAFGKDQEERHYEAALDVLEKLWTLVKKSNAYLTEKLESKEDGPDASPLYEELGGIWKLAELEELGCARADVRLIQLAFWVTFDEARREYIDTGCWADPETGEISLTCNYRPVKALKYVKQEDSIFGTARIAQAVYYPGEGNRRVRWERADIGEVSGADLEALLAKAGRSIAVEARAAKNFLKNAMAAPVWYRLLAFERIGRTQEGMVLQDEKGDTILLGDRPGMEETTERLGLLPDERLLERQVLLGGFYYDGAAGRLLLQPLSIVTGAGIVRLLY